MKQRIKKVIVGIAKTAFFVLAIFVVGVVAIYLGIKVQ